MGLQGQGQSRRRELGSSRLCSVNGASSEEGSREMAGAPGAGTGAQARPDWPSAALAVSQQTVVKAAGLAWRSQPPCLPRHLSAHRDSKSPPPETSDNLRPRKTQRMTEEEPLDDCSPVVTCLFCDRCLSLCCFCDSMFESPYCSKGVPESVTTCL